MGNSTVRRRFGPGGFHIYMWSLFGERRGKYYIIQQEDWKILYITTPILSPFPPGLLYDEEVKTGGLKMPSSTTGSCGRASGFMVNSMGTEFSILFCIAVCFPSTICMSM